MKQVLQNMRDGKTTVAEVPVPTPQRGQALVKVSASLVSAGTERMLVEFGEKNLLGKASSRPDLVKQVIEKIQREGLIPTLEATFNRLDSPMSLGYSSAGTIVALGADMAGFKIGQRVACAGGGYAVHAEYNLVPRSLLTPLPDSVNFESASFTTLGAIALHGLRLARPQVGESVAVIGLGLLGALTIQLAAASGCRVFGIDTNPERVNLARQFNIQAVTRSEAVSAGQAFTLQQGFDSVIICADTRSNDPIELAGQIARDRANIIATGAVGLSFPRKVYYEKELSFINSRSYGPGRYDPSYEEKGQDYPIGYIRWTEGRNFQAVVDLLGNGKLDVTPLISHHFHIDQAAQAYELITGKTKQPFLGVVLTYPEQAEAPSSRIEYHPAPQSHQTVRLGMIGAGLFANATLLPAIKKIPHIQLIGIASASGMHAQHSAQKFGFAYACSDEDQILQDPQVNSVAILTRHNSHADLSLKALQAGKHVFVEKPLALTLEELDEISLQLQKPNTGLLMVGFNRRFAPSVIALNQFLSNRTEPLYAHYRVNAGYIPLNHWTHDPLLGGGRLLGEGCHFIDLVSSLAGSAPTCVQARALPDNGKYREDNFSITISYADGSIAVVDYLANGDKSFQKERLEVFCGGKIGILDDYRSLQTVNNGSHKTTKYQQDKGHRAEMQAFVNGIKNGIPPIPYSDLINSTRTTLQALVSLRNNGENIKL